MSSGLDTGKLDQLMIMSGRLKQLYQPSMRQSHTKPVSKIKTGGSCGPFLEPQNTGKAEDRRHSRNKSPDILFPY
jgi:hypothetical protein